MTRTEFATAIAFWESGVNQSLTAQAAEVWYSVLGDIPAESLQVAVRRYLAEAEYPGIPPVGKLRRLAVEDIHGLPLTAGEDWNAVLTEIRQNDFRHSKRVVERLDPLTLQAVRAVGGFGLIGDSPETIMAGQFRRAYEALSERQQGLQRLPDDIRRRIGTAKANVGRPQISQSQDKRLESGGTTPTQIDVTPGPATGGFCPL